MYACGNNVWPVGIGGVGGSGTRLIAAILRASGFEIGRDLNESHDNLIFTLLFKWRGVMDLDTASFSDLWRVFEDAMTHSFGAQRLMTAGDWRTLVAPLADADRPQHSRGWLRTRVNALADLLETDPPESPVVWGWKEPNSHVVIDRLLRLRTDLRYVHVMRNGLDMAFSGNQNQLQLWGPRFLGRCVDLTPADSLAYWVAVHRRVERIAANNPGRVLMLNYDALCRDPEAHLPKLLNFVGCPSDQMTRARLRSLITPPTTIGRHRTQDFSGMSRDDIAYVRRLGFDADL